MWNDDPHLSRLVADSLINGVGFPVVQRLGRQVDDILDQIHSHNEGIEIIRSGSAAEGFRMHGSDIDKMIVDKYCQVVIENISMPSHIALLQMVIQKKRPGYVKLRLLTPDRAQADISQSIVQDEGQSIISSLKYREFYHTIHGGEMHGPCLLDMSNMGTEQDNAFCLKCKEWPTDAYEWLTRSRDFGWPSGELLEHIRTNGCHLMPIGSKKIINFTEWAIDPNEWRLSFSIAEKELVYTFNDTQFLVYGIFKLILKEILQRESSTRDCLCSYFMKSLMFWTIEETPENYWQPKHLMFCLDICFQRLINWVLNGYCPNYFVRETNMFLGKINDIQQQIVLDHLSSLHAEGWRCLLRCSSLRSLRKSLQRVRHQMISHRDLNLENDFYHLHTSFDNVSESKLDEMKDKRFFTELNSHQAAKPNLHALKDEFYNSVALEISGNPDEFTRDVITLYRCEIMCHTGLIYLHKALRRPGRTRNRAIHSNIRHGLLLLKCSKNADISRGNLTLATAYFVLQNYKKAMKCVSRYESILTDSLGILYISKHYSVRTFGPYNDNFCTGRFTRTEKAARAVSYDFEVYQRMPLIPMELELEIKLVKDTSFHLSFPPVIYSVFLKILCYAYQNKVNVVKQLRQSLLSASFAVGIKARYLVFLMLAITDKKLDDFESAMKYYAKSYTEKRRLIWSLPYCSERESEDSPLIYSANLLRLIL